VKLDNRKILLTVAGITILSLPIVLLTSGFFRIGFSLAVLLFCPGYALLVALFPKRRELKLIERVAFSLGISIAVVSVIGLSLYYTPLGLGLNSTFITTTVITVIAAAIGWYRTGRVSPFEDNPNRLNNVRQQLNRLPQIDKTLTVTLAAVIIICAGIFCFVAFIPNEGEQYTEFFILDEQGTTINYPDTFVLGETGRFTLGVISHEENPTAYHIEVTINGSMLISLDTGTLAPEEKWQDTVSFTATQTGTNQKVELWLYKQGESQPYNTDSLHFYIDVSEADS